MQDYPKIELVIIDNNSQDSSKNTLSNLKIKDLISLKIILNSKNIGFNAANSEGIKNSHGEFIALVNPDSFLEKSYISNIINFFNKNSEIMIVNGKIMNKDQTLQSTGGFMDMYGAVQQRKDGEGHYFYSPGSSVIFRRNILKNIDLDPRIFLYYDDVDLSWQLRLQGKMIGYCDKAVATHFEGHDHSGMSPEKFYFIAKNRIYICLKNYSFNNLIRRILGVIGWVLADGIYYSFNLRNPLFFLNSLKGIFWNLTNYSYLIKQRRIVQSRRVVKDSEIEKFMKKGSIEFSIVNAK
jgi:GT2 family glycosyltransferase